MSTYAIGDIHGCYATFQALLRQISFSSTHDQLWFVGDLVNRGPRSLDVLRWARDHGEVVVTVLGNHDLHLISVAEGVRKPKQNDTLTAVLDANDSDSLIEWLRHRPLIHYSEPFVLVHAGLLPQWTLAQADRLAKELAETLESPPNRRTLLARWQSNSENRWVTRARSTPDDLVVALNVFTRLRACTDDGRLDLNFTGPVDQIERPYRPWFEIPNTRDPSLVTIFGHWSALGLHVSERYIGLDSGCLWGRTLSAIRLEDRNVFQVQRCD